MKLIREFRNGVLEFKCQRCGVAHHLRFSRHTSYSHTNTCFVCGSEFEHISIEEVENEYQKNGPK